MDELEACLHLRSTYVWCYLCLILLLYYLLCCVMIMNEVMEFVLIK